MKGVEGTNVIKVTSVITFGHKCNKGHKCNNYQLNNLKRVTHSETLVKVNITLKTELCRAKMTFKSYPKKGEFSQKGLRKT